MSKIEEIRKVIESTNVSNWTTKSDDPVMLYTIIACNSLPWLVKKLDEAKAMAKFYGDKGNYVFHSPQIYRHEKMEIDIVSCRGGVAEDDGIKAREFLKGLEE